MNGHLNYKKVCFIWTRNLWLLNSLIWFSLYLGSSYFKENMTQYLMISNLKWWGVT